MPYLRQIVAVLRQIAGEILRTILRLSEVITHSEAPVTNPIAANEVRSIEEIIKDVSNQYEVRSKFEINAYDFSA